MKVHNGEFKGTPVSPEELQAQGEGKPLTEVERTMLELYDKRNETVLEKLEQMKAYNTAIKAIDEQLAGLNKERKTNQTRIEFNAN